MHRAATTCPMREFRDEVASPAMQAFRPSARGRLVGAVVPRVLALLLCVPLLGGRGLAVMVDAIAYPNGACCCERSHGAVHHCRCADPHEAEEADAAHQIADCASQCDDGLPEFATPNLWQMPLATISSPPELKVLLAIRRELTRLRPLDEGIPSPPPTPPPNALLV